MTAAVVPPLTWPPTDTDQPRWAHQLLHALADACQHSWQAHQQLTELLNELADHPPAPGQLAARLRAIDQHATDAHDSAQHHQLLRRHHLDHVAVLLARAQDHRIHALQTLRRLADTDHRHLLDPAQAAPHLQRILADLAAAGRALVHADQALLQTLDIPPTPGGDCYPQ